MSKPPRANSGLAVFLAAFAAFASAAGWLTSSAHAAPACSLFASGAGSDTNTGSEAHPFKTFRKLLTSLQAGQTGCLQSGQTFDDEGDLWVNGGETHGAAGEPVTVTSTDLAEPATITHGLSLEAGVNYVVFSGLRFNWAMPRPWVCWNSEGDPMPGFVITGPGTCGPGSASPEDAVQIVLGGRSDVLSNDEISSEDTNICVLFGRNSEGAVLENDRIHECGPSVEAAQPGFANVNEEWGWHTHGVYDYGHATLIRDDYIYDNARDGVLLYGGGEGAVVEHNIIDHNGAGIWFGNDRNSVAQWNIITGSTSPRGADDYGVGSYEPGSGDVAKDNCLDGNRSGEVAPGDFSSSENRTDTNPLYVDAQNHEYKLEPSSPCLGYGPDSAQPTTEAASGSGQEEGSGEAPESRTWATGRAYGAPKVKPHVLEQVDPDARAAVKKSSRRGSRPRRRASSARRRTHAGRRRTSRERAPTRRPETRRPVATR